MPSCQLCGEETDSTTLVKIEGAKMKVCSDCEDMGETVKTRSKRSVKKKKSKKLRPRESQVLVNDYGDRVKQAREDQKLSMQELANDLNEKQSVLSKVEKQELKPDKALAEKLMKKFGVDLYTTPEAHEYDTGQKGDSRSATLGDVAKVKDD
jgi:putative transcription factor